MTVDTFTVRRIEGDFEIWHVHCEEAEEATTNYGWSRNQKAGWLSWFLSGLAKVTWQRTVTIKQRLTWKAMIIDVILGQYGVNLDPRGISAMPLVTI